MRLRSEGEWFVAEQELIEYINLINEESNVFVEKDENRVMKYKTLPL